MARRSQERPVKPPCRGAARGCQTSALRTGIARRRVTGCQAATRMRSPVRRPGRLCAPARSAAAVSPARSCARRRRRRGRLPRPRPDHSAAASPKRPRARTTDPRAGGAVEMGERLPVALAPTPQRTWSLLKAGTSTIAAIDICASRPRRRGPDSRFIRPLPARRGIGACRRSAAARRAHGRAPRVRWPGRGPLPRAGPPPARDSLPRVRRRAVAPPRTPVPALVPSGFAGSKARRSRRRSPPGREATTPRGFYLYPLGEFVVRSQPLRWYAASRNWAKSVSAPVNK